MHMQEGGDKLKEKKTQAKSVRMTPTVYSIVDQCEGKGFNDKFERLVLQIKQDREAFEREVVYWEKIRAGYGQELEMVRKVRRIINDSMERLSDIDGILQTVYQYLSVLPPQAPDLKEQADGQSPHEENSHLCQKGELL